MPSAVYPPNIAALDRDHESSFLNKDKATPNTVQAESLPRHVTMDVDVACADLPLIDIDAILPKLTTTEKISLLSGSDNWHTAPIPKHGIPAAMSDGPNGVRGIYMFNGEPSSCFPSATGLASSWDLSLVAEIGRALAEECKEKGAHILLGPTVNTHRSPLGGRGFESFSEDPYLNGTMASSYISALQSKGVLATLKHYVNNDQETDRKTFNAIVSDRAMREIYLKPFQIAIKCSNPGAIMTSYNRVNGVHASESEILIKNILREEWGYDGLVMSDWSGTYSCTRALKAGLDLEMPGPSTVRGQALQRSLVAGKYTLEELDERVRKVLEMVRKCQQSGIPFDAPQRRVDTPELRELLRRSAADAVVLLKNDEKLLPLCPSNPSTPEIKRLGVIGYNADIAVTSGGGAAELLSTYKVTPLQGIRSAAQSVLGISPENVPYAVGAPAFRFVPLLDRYLRLTRGDKAEVGGLVEFWNEPFEADGSQKLEPIFSTQTFKSQLLLNDHIPSTVNMTCWFKYSGIFVPDQDGDWEFSLVVAGQANLYLDGQLIVDNTTNQTLGTYFLSQGTIEEKGLARNLRAGREYALEVRATNEIQLNHNSVYKTRGALRVGAWKPITDEDALNEAVAVAQSSDVAIVVVGLTQEFEAEAFDRPDYKLPGNNDALIQAVLDVNPNTIVITQAGTPLQLPWLERASTVAHAFYGGNDLGNGLADVLFGLRNPSAKLPVSWPQSIQDCPSYTSFGGENGNVSYAEGIYVGYRHPKAAVSFPFGHGLTYSSFSYCSVECPETIALNRINNAAALRIQVTVRNDAPVAGSEIIQVYVSDRCSTLSRPEAELKGFAKLSLQPGEQSTATIDLDRDAWAFWDDKRQSWVAEAGEFELRIGASFEDVRLTACVTLADSLMWRGL